VTEGCLPENEFLKTVMACIKRRCEILGLDAATKIRHEGETGGVTSEADRRGMIDGIMAKLGATEDDRKHEEDVAGVAGAPGPGANLGPDGAQTDAGGK
jgi:hypothetical protein